MSSSETIPQSAPLRARRFKTPRTVVALMLREMSTTYGRTPGGYFWAVMEPVAAITLLTFVFSAALRHPSLGTNFALFYATAMLPFQLYMQLSNKISMSLKFSRPLLRYPGVRYSDAIVARFLLNALTHLTISYLLFALILMLYRIETILDLPTILAAFGLAALLGLGVGCLNCYLITRFPMWGTLWNIITAPMFILSCIFFVLEDIPQQFRDILWFNPVVHITGLMRRGFYPTYDASYVSIPYVLCFGLITLALGLLLLNRYHRDLLNL
ncbi:ABC transporter permease [Roseobacter sp. N2S]|uniref:ABC transporter permease n=1 Tax=Roseobacter sp. N2S TaxID=2663844 RepID=UPI0028657B9C|nr:ABC transporter permease [Roseobacter sp. N2S]MDR6267640.1 capsular polysaccharide transport system permease protein [Roseobacter sp. N2S]